MSGHAVGMIEMGGGGGRTMVTADLTGSMPSYFSGINTTLTQVANTIGGEWGLVSHKDYSIRAILSNGQTVRYGNDPDFAFQVNTGWTNPTAFTTALKSLSVGGGGDGAECYSRVLWELTQPDTISRLGGSVTGWTLMVLDQLPHWRGGATTNLPFTDSIDPGRRADGGGDVLYPYIGGFNIDFLNNGIYPLRAGGSKICVWTVNAGSFIQTFWSQHADRVISASPGSSTAASQLISILSS